MSAPCPEPQTTLEHGVPLLKVSNLAIEFGSARTPVRVVDDVSFELLRGQTLGLVGESGSGKTVTSLAVMGLIGLSGGRISAGDVLLGDLSLANLPYREVRRRRRGRVGMIFQQPRRSLDPAFTVGDQIAETIRTHLGWPRRRAWKRAVELLSDVGIPSAARRAREYPYSFSGGMCQRIMIAIALATEPEVLIADEPTTALDVTVQAQILDLLKDLQEGLGLAILFITHDLAVIAETSDRVAVMYAGQIVEQGATSAVLVRPSHPYTEALVGSMPTSGEKRLRVIPGRVPLPTEYERGCRFSARCDYAQPNCYGIPIDLRDLDSGQVRCIRPLRNGTASP
jgi:peptide/nickel transport system ATP-binding protein